MTSINMEILQNIVIGEPRHHRNMTICPVSYGGPAGPAYISLDEALAAGEVVITEVSEGGSVPDLALKNDSRSAVLILDGEELQGAKQNRVLNTTIMVAAGERLKVPVSCTEQGRWAYSTREFSSSKHVMRHDVRSRKMGSVHASLSRGAGYAGDQMEVWENIQMMAAESGVSSPTSAMSDTFARHRGEVDAFVEAFPVQENQAGLLAFVDGKLAGCDFVSRPGVYAGLHAKLLRSYAVDAVVTRPGAAGDEPVMPAGDPVADFLAAVAQCKEETYASVGMGRDVRFIGQDLIGSALAVEGETVHAAFFPKPGQENDRSPERMLKSRRRAGNLWGRISD